MCKISVSIGFTQKLLNVTRKYIICNFFIKNVLFHAVSHFIFPFPQTLPSQKLQHFQNYQIKGHAWNGFNDVPSSDTQIIPTANIHIKVHEKWEAYSKVIT